MGRKRRNNTNRDTKPQGYGDLECKWCKISFPSHEKLMQHKAEKREDDPYDHIHCSICGMDFYTEGGERIHIRRTHQPISDLDCPGCGQEHFRSVAKLMGHIEKGQCIRISMNTLEELREERLKFNRDLGQLDEDDVKADFTNYMPKLSFSEPDRFVYRNFDFMVATGTVPKEQPPGWGDSSEEESPELGDSSEKESVGSEEPTEKESMGWGAPTEKESVGWGAPTAGVSVGWGDSSDEVTSTDEDRPAWTTKKDLFPGAPPAQRPTREQLENATAPSGRMLYDALSPHHPDSPHFNVEGYYISIVGIYHCPERWCRKTFDSAKALISHLRSPAHGEIIYRCPFCEREFMSLQSMVSHAEQSTERCRIRDTRDYGAYIDAITAGLVEVEEEQDHNGLNIYKMSEAARKKFGRGRKESKEKPTPVPGASYW